MEKYRTSIKTATTATENGGFRTEADNYNHIINDYLMRLSVIKESNIKIKKNNNFEN
jgi:hypothetical protein